MCMWELCICDLSLHSGWDSTRSVASLQRLGCRVCGELLRCCHQRCPPLQSTPDTSLLSVPVVRSMFGFVIPVKGCACCHTPGKAFDSQLSEVGDGREIGSHDGQWVWRVHKEAIFSKDHVPVLKQHNIFVNSCYQLFVLSFQCGEDKKQTCDLAYCQLLRSQ